MGDNEKLKITIEGEDKASPVITSTFGKVKQAMKGVMGSFTELNSAILIGEKIWNGFNKVLDATMGETIDYAEEVRDLSRLIGATPEEASKLIQAADDVKISYETMSSALEAGIRKGVEPTIEGIGELADEYNAIQSPIEKTKFLMDNFGRAGADLGPLMEKGSKGIKALGEAAEETGLVMDTKSIQAAREYEIAVDNLSDAMYALKIRIGNDAIPSLTSLAELSNDMLSVNNFAEGADASAKFINNFFFDAREKAQDFYETAKAKSDDLLEATDDLSGSMEELSETSDDLKLSEEELAAQAEELARQEDLVKQSMDELSTFMDGRLGEENEKYEEKLGDLQTELGETKTKIEELSNQDNLTEEQRAQLDELKGKYEGIQTSIKNVADEQDDATKRILFDMLQQQLAVDGLSTAEAISLGNVAESWGLIDEDTRIAWQSIQDYITGLGDAKIDANDLMMAVQGIPDQKTVTIDIFQNYFQNPSEAQVDYLGFASGGHFTVPPGYPNDSYPIGVSSGEEVDVAPAGGGGGGLTFNLYYSPMVSTMDRNELELRLKPVIEGVVRKYR